MICIYKLIKSKLVYDIGAYSIYKIISEYEYRSK